MKYLTFAIALAIAAGFAFSSPASANTYSYAADQLGLGAYNSCMYSRQDTMPNRAVCAAERKAKQVWHLNACRAKLAAIKVRDSNKQHCLGFQYGDYYINC